MGALTTPKTQVFVKQRKRGTILLQAVMAEQRVQIQLNLMTPLGPAGNRT